jgi:hypothetical protein
MCVFILSKTFPILKRIQPDIVKNVETSSCKALVIVAGFLIKHELSA